MYSMKNILVSLRPYGKAERQFLAGIVGYARPHADWTFHFDPSPEHLTPENFDTYVKMGIAGAIVCETGVPDIDAVLLSSSVPVVVFGSPRENVVQVHANVGWSMSNDEGIGALVAEYFMSLGKFRTYAFVADPLDSGWSRGHCRGFSARLKNVAHEVRVFKSSGMTVPAARKIALAKWLMEIAKPAAVMTANDIVGAELAAIARTTGTDVPRSVSIVGVGNETLIDELVCPSLSSVEVDHEEEGANAARLLQRMIRGKVRRPTTIQSNRMRIIERDSTKAIAPAVHLIESALQYIADNADRCVKISQVVEHLHVSRRLLDMRFRQYHHETIGEAIMRLRLDEVRRRLLTTSLSFRRIASSCGFQNPHYLKKLLRKRFNEELVKPQPVKPKNRRNNLP